MKMLFALSGLVIACSMWHVTEAAYGFSTCTREYVKIGCFKEKNTDMDLIVNDRDGHGHELQWGNVEASLHSLACRCSEKARAGGYEYFSIRFWAECWAGKDRGALDAVIRNGKHFSNDCMQVTSTPNGAKKQKFEKCEDTHDGECAGKPHSEYIYTLESKAPQGIDGGFSDWGIWTPCSSSCGMGEKIRERACNVPEPQGGGLPCNGNFTQIAKCKKAECPVDGILGLWSNWGACSKSCGEGTHQKTRDCTLPTHGGKPCAGALQQTERCNKGECPVDGKVSSWTPWTPCSQSCGKGTQERSRACTAPLHGGKACIGDLSQIKNCLKKHCPVDGKLGPWGTYSSCSASCGPGTKVRERTCTAPKYGGSPCSGVLTQDADCKLKECPVNGGWGAWKIGTCKGKCGTGNRVSTRSCNKPEPKHGGATCRGSSTYSEACKLKACPVDGTVGPWTSWNRCNKECGTGTQTRSRACFPPKHGGKPCPTPLVERKECHIIKLCPVHAVVGTWSAFSACSKSCGPGTQTRTRSCIPAQHGGRACPTNLNENKKCEIKACSVDGKLNSWSSFSTCSKSCGPGTQTRTRTCTPPQHGGKPCSGPLSASQNCQIKPCKVDGTVSLWTSWNRCNKECETGTQTRTRACFPPKHGGKPCPTPLLERQNCQIKHCPVHAVVGTWSAFSACSKSCGPGTQTRTRSCIPAQHGGRACPTNLKENENCETKACPVNGGWGDWTEKPCSRTCGTGTKVSTRSCNNPAPKHGGDQCWGSSTKSVTCQEKYCPVDCVWKMWSGWTFCSKSCGNGGTQQRTRTFSYGQYGGKGCVGVKQETKTCKVKECPVNGGWGDWTAKPCSRTCGTGTKVSTRSCNNPAPKYGGAKCFGISTNSETCRVKHCPVNGVWDTWSDWTVCTKSCGDGGNQKRTRACEPPKYGGNACSGEKEETKICKIKECPVNGGWGAWSTAACSRTCGAGVKVSSRSCNNPTPKHGGASCSGSATKQTSCKIKECETISKTCAAAPWDTSFDRAGTVTCSDWKQFMTGLYRNSRPRTKNFWGHWSDGDDGIYLIEKASCCKISDDSGFNGQPTHCWSETNWKHKWDANNRWVICPNGRFMRGLTRSGGSRLHNIEAATCCEMGGGGGGYGLCYEQSVSMVNAGWNRCRAGYIMAGMHRGGCDDLRCIDKFKCCTMKPRY